jgi:hypothetical protein
MTAWLNWFFPNIIGNGTLVYIVAGAAGWLWLRWEEEVMIESTTLVNCDFCDNVIELSWTCLPTQADYLG